jgi:small GTP-binding protein
VETVTPAPGITFTVWDIGGQDKIRPLYRHYFDKTDGLLFVVDSSDQERLKEARDELFGIITNESMSTVPVVIIANKSDLPTAIKPSELIQQLSLHSIARRRWYIQSACALTGDGIVEGMQQLSKMIKDKRKSTSN